ncbi:Flp family type IVb pilin [Caballeronia sp. M1242]|uniref:Flp family type IVb pilin n=1 Tax=Caballeronia sp. M1242 TaxID=2814653 RepID=UPI0019D18591|nr:Flp family type IVb pilin [Caballeronia sp. M1242]QSN63007.1 Flp family type IVb pilin [Caballeronia sp. M1242]
MRKFIKAFVRDERGVSAMEYAILAGIVAVALGALASGFSSNIQSWFSDLNSKVTTAKTNAG